MMISARSSRTHIPSPLILTCSVDESTSDHCHYARHRVNHAGMCQGDRQREARHDHRRCQPVAKVEERAGREQTKDERQRSVRWEFSISATTRCFAALTYCSLPKSHPLQRILHRCCSAMAPERRGGLQGKRLEARSDDALAGPSGTSQISGATVEVAV